MNTAIGSGMLSLSAAVAKFGYVFGICMLLAAACNLYIGLYCFKSLIVAYPEAKIYSGMVEKIIGKVKLFL